MPRKHRDRQERKGKGRGDMRQLLMAVMLMMAVVLLYNRIVGGEGGTRDLLRDQGREMAEEISRIDP
ncbi:MAG: hypothetical protein BAA02_03070 [Paenibacillaceae bacterium ZCTH02-B3]|nr:MAG: hypothetical protein BAA02_03070 [Paenibacillaceae bacterium ZCTH02-B3]